MRKPVKQLLLCLALFPGCSAFAGTGYYGTNYVPSAPAAGMPGSTAVYMTSNAITAWASGYTNLQYGTDVAVEWQTPDKALGPALGTSDDVVSLGRGGEITLTFPAGIGNGPGADFVLFENSFDGQFLELAYVEVSSDGTNFVRFPNYSYTTTRVSSFSPLETELIYGLASKYQQGYGTPFDLEELHTAYTAQLAGLTDFSSDFATMLTNRVPLLDLDHVTHVRLVDVVGDGSSSMDSRGQPVFDPYPTSISAGFDLDAVGVIHEALFSGGSGPLLQVIPANDFFTVAYSYDQTALTNCRVQTSLDLSGWSNAIPETVGLRTNGVMLSVTNRFLIDTTNRFYRLQLDQK